MSTRMVFNGHRMVQRTIPRKVAGKGAGTAVTVQVEPEAPPPVAIKSQSDVAKEKAALRKQLRDELCLTL